MVRRKLALKPTGKPRPDSPGDYVLYVTTRFAAAGRLFSELALVRRADGRTLYPFEGAPPIGPFPTVETASAAATEQGATLIEADLRNPEP